MPSPPHWAAAGVDLGRGPPSMRAESTRSLGRVRQRIVGALAVAGGGGSAYGIVAAGWPGTVDLAILCTTALVSLCYVTDDERRTDRVTAIIDAIARLGSADRQSFPPGRALRAVPERDGLARHTSGQ